MGKRIPFTQFPVRVWLQGVAREFSDEGSYVRFLLACRHEQVVWKGMDLGGIEVKNYTPVPVCTGCGTVLMAGGPPFPVAGGGGP